MSLEPWHLTLVFQHVTGEAVRALEHSDKQARYHVKWCRSRNADKQGEGPPAMCHDGTIRWGYKAQFVCGIKRSRDKLEKKLMKIQLRRLDGGKKLGEIFIDLSKYVEKGNKEYQFPVVLGDKKDPAKLHIIIAAHQVKSFGDSTPTEDTMSAHSRSSGGSTYTSSPTSRVSDAASFESDGFLGSPQRPSPTQPPTQPPAGPRLTLENLAAAQNMPTLRAAANQANGDHRTSDRHDEASSSAHNTMTSPSGVKPVIKNVSRLGSDWDGHSQDGGEAARAQHRASQVEITRLKEQVEALANQVRQKDEDIRAERHRKTELERSLESKVQTGDEGAPGAVRKLKDENRQYREQLEKERREKERLQWEYSRKKEELQQQLIEKQEFYEEAQRALKTPVPRHNPKKEQCMECSLM